MEPFDFSFFSISGWGIDLDYSDTEWQLLKTAEWKDVCSSSPESTPKLQLTAEELSTGEHLIPP